MSVFKKLTAEHKPLVDRINGYGSAVELDASRVANESKKVNSAKINQALGKVASAAGVVYGRDSEIVHTTGEVPEVPEDVAVEENDQPLGKL